MEQKSETKIMKTRTFKDLVVWQKAKELAVAVYRLTDDFPKSEMYGLTSQTRRAVISISSNIAESYHRFHEKEKQQFLWIAFASSSELESQPEVSKELFLGLDYKKAENLLTEVMKILNRFVK